MIADEITKVSYRGDGTTKSFPFTFHYNKAADVKAIIYDTEAGTETAITSDYYVDTTAGTYNYPGYAPGQEAAEADQPPVLTATKIIVIYRETPETQLIDLGEKYPLPTIEGTVDKLTMIVQEHDEKLSRAVKVPLAVNYTPDELLKDIYDKAVSADAAASVAAAKATEAQSSANAAAASATAAAGSATAVNVGVANAKIWAEGTDSQVQALGGTKSAKRWAELSVQHYYDTVAEMVADTTLEAGQACRVLGHYAIGDGGGAFYKIKTTTTNYTENLSNGLKAEMVPGDYVTPQQYGAHGDGQAHIVNGVDVEAQAIQRAVDSGAGKVYLPGNSTYNINDTITIGSIDFIMDGSIIYNGSSLCIQINTPYKRKIKLNIKYGGTSPSADGMVGVKIVNAADCDINLYTIDGFNIGALLHGNNKGFAYNKINVNFINNCVTGIKCLCTESGGYFNENIFYGGRFTQYSSFTAQTTAVVMIGSTYHIANNNRFYAPCLEGAYGFNLSYSEDNFFYDVRTEDVIKSLITDVHCMNNHLYSGYGSTDAMQQDINGVDFFHAKLSSAIDSLKYHLYDGSDIVLSSVRNSTQFIARDMYRVVIGNLDISNISAVTKDSDGIIIPDNHNIGWSISCDTDLQKMFMVKTKVVSGNYRLYVIMFDDAGNQITGAENKPLTMGGSGFVITTVQGKQAYRLGSNVTNEDYIFKIPKECKRTLVFVACDSSAGLKCSEVHLYADKQYKLQRQMVVSPTIPTVAGYSGQIVPCSDPISAGAKYWIYSGTEWLTVV